MYTSTKNVRSQSPTYLICQHSRAVIIIIFVQMDICLVLLLGNWAPQTYLDLVYHCAIWMLKQIPCFWQVHNSCLPVSFWWLWKCGILKGSLFYVVIMKVARYSYMDAFFLQIYRFWMFSSNLACRTLGLISKISNFLSLDFLDGVIFSSHYSMLFIS